MKKVIIAFAMLATAAACHENIEERAAREAREYTEKFCPTPTINFIRTDSLTFDIPTKTYTYYCSVMDKMDNETIINMNKDKLKSGLLTSIKQNTNIMVYKKANFNFAYILYSGQKPGKVMFKATYSPKDYAQ